MINNSQFLIRNYDFDYSTGSEETPIPQNFVQKDVVIENIDNKTQIQFDKMTVYLDDNCNLLQIPLLLENIVKTMDNEKCDSESENQQQLFEDSIEMEEYYLHVQKQKQQSFILKNKQVAIYDDLSNKFIDLGVEPYFHRQLHFTAQQFRNSSTLYFQVSSKYISSACSIFPIKKYQKVFSKLEGDSNENQSFQMEENKNEEQTQTQQQPLKRKRRKMNPEKRVKERSIQEVKDKVVEWRQIQEREKINLDKAAKVIGISRKTLDDYCLQLRKATEFGFDFCENQLAKMGTLRKFVKENEKLKAEQKQKEKLQQQQQQQQLSEQALGISQGNLNQQKKMIISTSSKNSETFISNIEDTADSDNQYKLDDIEDYFNFNNNQAEDILERNEYKQSSDSNNQNQDSQCLQKSDSCFPSSFAFSNEQLSPQQFTI